MRARRISTAIGLVLVVAGTVLLLLPYRTHAQVTLGFAEPERYSIECQAPVVDALTTDPPQRWYIRGTDQLAEGTGPSYPSPCHSERGLRAGAAALLIALGAGLWLVAWRRSRRAGARADATPTGTTSEPTGPVSSAPR